MERSTVRIVNAAVFGATLVWCMAATSQSPGPLRWYKGNTHTHTLNQGGDSTPDDVVRWYREHDYNFVVISDHNMLTSVEGLNALHAAADQFIVVKGEEVTDSFQNASVHVNGLDISRKVDPQGGTSIVDVLQRNVDAVRAANGVPHINHPNFRWSITADQLRQVRNNRLFEIFNGHPQVNNLGGGGVPGMEQAWDSILSAGTLLYGIAVDDAHVFKQPGNRAVSGPGRGWVVIRAPRLEARALLEALEKGDFYASTGVELVDYNVTPKAMTVTVKPNGAAKYRVQFIGQGGRVLEEGLTSTATYTFTGKEGYVRAKVIESNGALAWTQPAVVNELGRAATGPGAPR